MQKCLLMIVTVLLFSTGMAFATGQSPGGSGIHDPFTCEKNDAGDFVCYCAGESDCQEMQDSGVCDMPFPQGGPHASSNDTACDSDFGGVGEYACNCTATSTAPGTSRRPGSFNPATENAPRESTVRDHRRSRRAISPDQNAPADQDDIVAPNNRSADRQNEVVRARPGTVAENSSKEDEEETDQTPTRRDHRR